MKETQKKGLYIHIPFCSSKCPYCDFYSFIPKENIIDRYIDCLVDELNNKTRLRYLGFTDDDTFDTVYIGGGTPSCIGGDNIERLLDTIHSELNIDHDAEVTVECNPASAGDDFFSKLKGKANRVSVGLQSAVDSERKRLGRMSGREDVKGVIARAHDAGIDNISLDLMLGVPNQTIDSLSESLSFCIDSGVKHISCYMLTIEENTPFYRMEKKLNLPDEDDVCEMYLYTADTLDSAGFKQYEVSNFAVPGFESRHNTRYWKLGDYFGLGPSAHSFVNGKRYYFERDIDSFLEGGMPVFDCLGGDEEEYIMLRLRLAKGLNFEDYKKYTGKSLPEKTIEKMKDEVSLGLATMRDETFSLTPRGFLVSNDIISDILVCM